MLTKIIISIQAMLIMAACMFVDYDMLWVAAAVAGGLASFYVLPKELEDTVPQKELKRLIVEGMNNATSHEELSALFTLAFKSLNIKDYDKVSQHYAKLSQREFPNQMSNGNE